MQPAGTAFVYVHDILCSLHICAVSCVGTVRIYDEQLLQNDGTQTSEHDTGSKGACMHMSRINNFFTVASKLLPKICRNCMHYLRAVIPYCV